MLSSTQYLINSLEYIYLMDSQIDFVCIVLTFFIHFLHKPLTKREKLLHSLLTKCKMQNFGNFRNG